MNDRTDNTAVEGVLIVKDRPSPPAVIEKTENDQASGSNKSKLVSRVSWLAFGLVKVFILLAVLVVIGIILISMLTNNVDLLTSIPQVIERNAIALLIMRLICYVLVAVSVPWGLFRVAKIDLLMTFNKRVITWLFGLVV